MKINGPYGSYESGSVGAVLNTLSRVYGLPTVQIDCLTIGDGVIHKGNKLYGTFTWNKNGTLDFLQEQTK